ncbi:MAG: NfeD family protein [Spirochaetota bacterium]
MIKRAAFFLVAAAVLLLQVQALFSQETAAETKQPVYVVPISGTIDQGLTVFLRRSIEKAKADQAKLLVFDIDTFGGRVDSALEIASLIGSLADIDTVAYVGLNPEGTSVSWSAGALIAMSTNRTYMAPGTSMGAAAPVIQSAEGGSQMADEKTVSAVRTQMAALAEKNGYPRAIALAMVDMDVELVEATVDGELRAVTRDELEALKRNSEQEITEGSVISETGKLLSLTAQQMERYGVSSGTVGSLDGLLSAELDPQSPSDYRIVETAPSQADRAVRVLTGGAVTSLLILIGIIGMFIEISSPGFGVPGAIGLAAFAALFAGNVLLGTVGSVELLLFVLGIALIIIEIFVIPGFGVAGISGLAMMAIGLVLSMQDFVIPSFSWQWDLLGKNVLIVLGNMIAGFVAFGVLAFLVPKYTPFRRLTLSLNQESSQGYTSQDEDFVQKYSGKKGIAVTTLRPSGKAEIEDEVVQVVTTGEFLEKDTPVEVTQVSGNRIVVKRSKR